MRIAEKVAPIVGAASALGALACCMPLGGAAALGLGSLLGAAAQYQEWMLPLSGGFLALGAGLMWRSRRICRATSRWSLAILMLSALVVLLVLVVPQTVVGFLADWLS